MAFKFDRLKNERAQTRQFGRDSVKQLQALRRSSGRNKAPRKLFSRERREASRSQKSRRLNSGRINKQQQQLYQQVTNPRNWYHQDIVKNLLKQLAELNETDRSRRPTTKDKNLSEATMYNIESTTVVSEEQLGNIYGQRIKTNRRDRTKFTKHSPRHTSSSVADLIEKHVLRDITRHLLKKKQRSSTEEVKEEPKNIHEEESASGMKVVITKIPKQDSRSVMQLSEISSVNKKFLPPFAKQGFERRRLRKPVRLKSERISLPSLKDKPPTLTAPAKLETRQENVTQDEKTANTNKTNNKPKQQTVLTLPKINEETDSLKSSDIVARGRSFAHNALPYTVEKSTNTEDFHNLFDMISPPEVTSDSDSKVKLPILGKSIGTARYSNSENGSKRAYFREVRKMIHGLYGEYFEPPMEGNFTYESQLISHYEQMSRRKSLNYVTPTLEEDCTAGSYTLQLYHSAQAKQEDSQVNSKSNKMSIPVIRNKYGQTIALSKRKTAGKKEAEVQTVSSEMKFDPLLSLMLPLHEQKNIYKVIQEDYLPRMTSNTPDSAAVDLRSLGLHEQFAHQVSLYRDQVAKEQAYLRGIQSGIELPKMRHAHMLENSAYDGVDIDLYLEIKHRKSLERRMRLKELKQRHKNRQSDQQHNSHLEVVEQRQKFLSLLNRNNVTSAENPKTSESLRTQNFDFEYYHDKIPETPITKIIQRKESTAPERHSVDTKIYRIFGERKKQPSSENNPENNKSTNKGDKKPAVEGSSNLPRILQEKKSLPAKIATKTLPRFAVVNPPMSDLVSRFPMATRYKLDREYVKALASSTT